MSKVSSDNIEITELAPDWLNREYIESAIRQKFNDDAITVTRIKIVPAAEKGEHFLSALFRIHVSYKTRKASDSNDHQLSMVAKTEYRDSENPSISDAAESFDVLSHEIFMYNTVLPKIVSQLETIGQTSQLAPNTIKVDPERKCIIMYDLCHLNYQMANKKVGLDMDHAKLALKKLAEFNAAGAKLNEMGSGYSQKFTRNAFSTDAFGPFFRSQIELCGQAVQKWKGYEQYGKKLIDLAPKVMDGGKKLFQPEPNHFHTLIHSDFWINNMMFKYDANRTPVDCILIDFQVNCWASPAIDLIYFVNTSLEDDIKWDHEKELIQYYHLHLANTLMLLKYKGKIPTFDEFWSQYTDKGFNAVTSVCMVLPLILKDPETSLIDEDGKAIEPNDAPYFQPRVHKTLKRLLPIFDEKGLLNYV